MTGKYSQTIARVLASCSIALAVPVTACSQSATAIPKLDLNRITGTWSELYHLPTKAERKCLSDATVLYALADKPTHLQIVFTCQVKDNATNVRNKDAKLADKSGDGKLKVAGLFPFFIGAAKSWVLATAPDYSWLLVGSPNHKSLMILSRSETLSPAILADLQSRATSQGYPVARLVPIPQTP